MTVEAEWKADPRPGLRKRTRSGMLETSRKARRVAGTGEFTTGGEMPESVEKKHLWGGSTSREEKAGKGENSKESFIMGEEIECP